MKKALLIILAMLVIGRYALYLNHHYTREATVVDNCTAVDDSGNVWKVDTRGYRRGEEVVLCMYDNNTIEIYDDVVERIR